jgi:hypothetical protein
VNDGAVLSIVKVIPVLCPTASKTTNVHVHSPVIVIEPVVGAYGVVVPLVMIPER